MKPKTYCVNCGDQLTAEWGQLGADGDCLLVDKCDCENEGGEKIITCWYQDGGYWHTGFFHEWSVDFEANGNGPGQFPVAIIEDATDSNIHLVYAESVSFSPENPEPGREVLARANHHRKFEPRLYTLGSWQAVQVHPEVIELFNSTLQETGVMLKFVHQCQVRWVNGEIQCSRGGIPRDILREIFQECNHETS